MPKKQWAGIYVHTSTHVLLIPHPEVGWTLPGGRIDTPEEDPRATAIRHVRRHTGLEFPFVPPQGNRWTTGDVPGWKCCIFQHPVKDTLPVAEGSAAQWRPKASLPPEFAAGRLWRTLKMAEKGVDNVVYRNRVGLSGPSLGVDK